MRRLWGANSTFGAVILMSSVANVAEGGVDDCCCWMDAIRTRASAEGESSADAVRTGGGGVESGLLLPPVAPLLVAMVEDGLTSAAEGLALREGEERVGDRARVAAAGAGRMSPGLGEEGKQRRKKVEVNIRSELFARRTSAESKKSNKHDGRRRQGHAPVVVPRVRGDARKASHQGGHARGRR